MGIEGRYQVSGGFPRGNYCSQRYVYSQIVPFFSSCFVEVSRTTFLLSTGKCANRLLATAGVPLLTKQMKVRGRRRFLKSLGTA